ncbi:hypothetical protein FQA39_LY02437 [Lamprigera yunnana]|nr:hypothetical protein FQA39_LY02437 [Lamprigera yunnana]
MIKDNKKQDINKEEITKYALLEKQNIIIDLVAELAIVLNEKANLEHENAALKLEKQELSQKLIDVERSIKVETNDMMKNVIESQGKVQEKENTLAKKEIEWLEEQKSYLLEVKDLKLAYYKQKQDFDEKEKDLSKKIAHLKNQLYHDCNIEDLKAKADNYTKYTSYKKKVKYAIIIIKELIQELKKYKKIQNVMSKECHTVNQYKVDGGNFEYFIEYS